MKKFKYLFLYVLGLVVILITGCSGNLSKIMQKSLSEVRYNLFTASNEFINVKFTSGFREDPYVLNGKSENKKEFGVITVKFLGETINKNGNPEFIITINEMDFDGEFILNPFDQSYVQDIETFVLDDYEIFIKIKWQDFEFESKLINISNSFNCNHKQALNIFTNEYKKNIEKLIKQNTIFETYVKIINDPSLDIDKNYFYVCIISSKGESFSVIIDPMSSKILAKNESNNQTLL